MNTLQLQEQISTYFEVTPEVALQLAHLFQPISLNRHDFLIQEGKRHIGLSLIRFGYVRVFRSADQKEVTQWISAPGEFITDLNTLLFDQPSRWNIQAITDIELLTLSPDAYRNLSKEIPTWSMIERSFLAKCFTTMEERIFAFLSMSAEERYQFFYETRSELFHQVPQQYLASMLAMTPETFSRIRAKRIS